MSPSRTQPAARAAVLGSLFLVALLAGGCGGDAKPTTSGAAESAVTGSYAFWPQFPDDPRIQFVRSFKSSDDVSPKQASGLEKLVFGKDADQSESINKPYGVAMHDGKIYVCDMRASCLTVMDLRKKQTRLLGTSGNYQLKHPIAVAVADDGQIYVADNERGAIQVFDASERYSTVIGHEKFKPGAVAVHGDRLYATNMTAQNVEIFDRNTGALLGTMGTVGDEDGQFRLPLGIATDPKGDVYVVDMMRCRVQKFSPDGKFISGFGALGDTAGSFARPKHIAVDSDGIVYVVDASFQNVQMFDSQNRLLMHFGAAGAFPGAMNLPAGIGVCEDSLDLVQGSIHPGFEPKRLIVIANQFGDAKISLYAMGGLRKGHTARELASAAAKVETGVGEPSKEQLRMQTPTGDPGAAEGAGGAKPSDVENASENRPR